MATSLETGAAADPCDLAVAAQLNFFSDESAVGPPDSAERAPQPLPPRGPTRIRRPELSFPDEVDTQLSFVPHPPQNQEEWSSEGIEVFHQKTLVMAVRSLYDGRGCDEMSRRVIAWIARPLVDESQLFRSPLSFQAACYTLGFDPRIAQRKVLRRFAPELLEASPMSHPRAER